MALKNERAIQILEQRACCRECVVDGECTECNEAFDMAIKAIEQKPRKGHWLTHKEYCDKNNLLPSGLGIYFWCSNCDCAIGNEEWHRNHYKYCPNCGSDMREAEE